MQDRRHVKLNLTRTQGEWQVHEPGARHPGRVLELATLEAGRVLELSIPEAAASLQAGGPKLLPLQ